LAEFEVVKDSGERIEYNSGMVRDTQEGKPDYTLVDLPMLERWAMHMTLGAKKYGRENWQLARSLDELIRFRASAFRHFIQWLRGDRDEDHAAAVYFNIAAAEHVKEKLDEATGTV
jgi:DNA polymerase II small subunit/DNA polymerase delta subunit B